jgi:hypothetical protein
MALKNGPQFPVVTKGKAVNIGTFTAATDQLQFTLAPDSVVHCGSLIVQVVANGTVTTLTADIRISLDGGTTFNAQTVAGAATVASATAGLNFAGSPLQSVALPGVASEAILQFVVLAGLAFGTATSAKVLVLMA